MRRRHAAIAGAVLLLGLATAALLIATPVRVEVSEALDNSPLVEASRVVFEDVQLRVRTHGTVVPRTESDLVPEVSGRTVWVSPSLVSGGAFEPDEVLLRIDDSDYRIAKKQARASLAQAESERTRARRELERQKQLKASAAASASRLEDAENTSRVAEAVLRGAQAAVERAELDLARSEIRAPYRGRVRSEQIDVGQFVSRGQPVARLYAVDFAEVRLPIRDADLPRLEPGLLRGGAEVAPAVLLAADFAGARYHWQGVLTRVEAEIDPKTRMIYGVARVDDPFGVPEGGDPQALAPPLTPGLFVEAEIAGRAVSQAIVVPRAAVRQGDQVWVVDDSGRLRARRLRVVQADRRVIVG